MFFPYVAITHIIFRILSLKNPQLCYLTFCSRTRRQHRGQPPCALNRSRSIHRACSILTSQPYAVVEKLRNTFHMKSTIYIPFQMEEIYQLKFVSTCLLECYHLQPRIITCFCYLVLQLITWDLILSNGVFSQLESGGSWRMKKSLFSWQENLVKGCFSSHLTINSCLVFLPFSLQ